MNERIEQAAEEYANSTTSNFLNVFETTGRFEGFINGANYALSHQWISVDEELPQLDSHGYSKQVLVLSNLNELLVATYNSNYKRWNSVGPLSYHGLIVTHWMEIPSRRR